MRSIISERCHFVALLVAVSTGLLLGGCSRTPVVEAGEDMEVITGDLVGLGGTVELKKDKHPVTVSWRMVEAPAGSEAVLTAADTLTPWFVADTAGTYLLELRAEQDERVGKGEVAVTAVGERLEIALRPSADAGADQQVATNEIAQLLGEVTDPSEGGFGVAWHFISIPSGSNAQLSGAATLTPWFLVDRPGDYVVELEATNEYGSNRDRVVVTASGDPTTFNRRPVADAGEDMMAPAPGLFADFTLAELDGAGSFHPEGGPFTLEWVLLSRPIGSLAGFLDLGDRDIRPYPTSNVVNPTLIIDYEGEYELALYACNQDVCGTPDTVVVTAEGARNLEIVMGDGQQAPVDDGLDEPMVFRAVNSAGQSIPGVPVGLIEIEGPYDEDHGWRDDVGFMEDATDENGLAFAWAWFNDVAGPRSFVLGALADMGELQEFDMTIAEVEFSATAIAGHPAGIRFAEVDADEVSVLEPYTLTAFIHDDFGNIVTWENELELLLLSQSPAAFADEAEIGTLIEGGGTAEVVVQVSQGVAAISIGTQIAAEIWVAGAIELDLDGFLGPMSTDWDDIELFFSPGPPVELAFVRLLEGASGGNAHKDSKRGGKINVLVVARDELGNAAYPDGPDKLRFWLHAEGDGEDTPEFLNVTSGSVDRGIIVAGRGEASVLLQGGFFGKREQQYFGAEVRMTNENVELVTLTLEDVNTGLDDSATTTRRYTGDPASFVSLNDDPLLGVAGQNLPETVGVRVEDEDGLPIPGIWIEWIVDAGGGVVEGEWDGSRWASTNQNGEAFVNWWRLGPNAGDDTNVLIAEMGTGCDFGLDDVEFVASAEPSVPARIVLLPYEDPEPGEETIDLEIEVQDRFGHLVENADPVRFTLRQTNEVARFTGASQGRIIAGEGSRDVYVETEDGRLVIELTNDSFGYARFTVRDTDGTGLAFEGFGGRQPLYQSDFQGNDGGMEAFSMAPGRDNSWQWGTPTYGPTGVQGRFNSRAWGTHLDGYAYANEASCLATPWFFLPPSGSIRTHFGIWVETRDQMRWWSQFCNEDGACYNVTNESTSNEDYWRNQSYTMSHSHQINLGGDLVQFRVCVNNWSDFFADPAPAGVYLSDIEITHNTGSNPTVHFRPEPAP